MKTQTTVTLNEVEATMVRFFRLGGDPSLSYVWTHDGKLPAEFECMGNVSLSGLNAYWGSGQWFVFVIADCAFPLMFAVQHHSFESAYEEFCDWQVDHLKIDETDLKDYDPETLNYSGNGIPIDTEAIQGFEVRIAEVRC